MLAFKTLTNTSLAEITATFNRAFSDYFLPITYSEALLKLKLETEGGRLDLSVGAFQGDKLVGFILHFYHEIDGLKVLYNGATGVVPEHRGKRLTSQMYAFITPYLDRHRIDKMVLEVLTQNTGAIKIYEAQGFSIKRTLNCFKGDLIKEPTRALMPGYTLKSSTAPTWNSLQAFWDYAPTWQNAIPTIDKLADHTLLLAIEHEGQSVAYLVYNTTYKRIHQLAVAPAHRNKGLGTHLLAQLAKQIDHAISYINLDASNTATTTFLADRGLAPVFTQYEMEFIR